jgi:CBS domain containing-hemolysin-like protein
LIFGELIPKYFARELADRVILITSLPLRFVTFLMYPFVKITSTISNLLTGSSSYNSKSITAENVNLLFSKEDLEILVKESHRAGMVDEKESDIISKVLALGDQRVYEAMRPRTEIIGVEISSPVDEALILFIESGYSKLPVYDENLDNIKGIIYANDFFTFPENIKGILKEAIFIPETKKSLEMLNEFLSKQVSIAIVVDEFGGTAGIVTMEDIFEELFGEIRDEYDVDEHICRKISANEYLISGKVEIDFINEKYNLNIPVGDYETIAGYIITRLGRIPAQGDNISLDGFNILIARANQTRIDIVRLTDNREKIL